MDIKLNQQEMLLLERMVEESVAEVGVRDYAHLSPHEPVVLTGRSGTIALDGEREIEFHTGSRIEISLDPNGPQTIDVAATLTHAAQHRLLRHYAGGAA